MHLFDIGVPRGGKPHGSPDCLQSDNSGGRFVGSRLRAGAILALAMNLAVSLSMATAAPVGYAQQAPTSSQAPAASNDKTLADLPGAPTPTYTEPLFLRPTARDFSKPIPLRSSPLRRYLPTTVAKASFYNSVRLADLVKNGKIYLSLSDAITLALENNYDIAIARYNLDIADTDILRTKSGSTPLGVNSGLVSNTLGGASSSLSSGGGPGGTTVGSGGAGSGSGGLVLTTAGAGPAPANFDPYITSQIQLERTTNPSTSPFNGGTQNTDIYDFTYNQGFTSGANFTLAFNNTRSTTDNEFNSYSPLTTANLKATLTQPLLQGAGFWVNKRFIQEAIYDRRITDSSFRQQILYTVNQVENIYWSLVSAYEDLQAKERALEQSTKLANDDRKQLEIGTLAPLDVVNADSSVATDKQALVSSQSNLNYQQLLIKQAIARNLNDPALVVAPVIPTDRVSLDELPEEKMPAEELVQQAFQNRPELEQAVLQLKNDEITLKGAKNALLPTLNAYAFYSGTGVAGVQSPDALNFETGTLYPKGTFPTVGYGTALGRMLDNTFPDKGVGFNLNIPIRNRTAQSVQARSLLEYRQAQLRLEQQYTQIRMQVINAQFALTNDRAQVRAAGAAEQYAQQSLDAENTKLRLGASTTANVLQQQRNLATAENNLIAAKASYAVARASLYQLLASTLQHYGISMGDAVTGEVKEVPVVPGLEAPKNTKEPTLPTPPAM